MVVFFLFLFWSGVLWDVARFKQAGMNLRHVTEGDTIISRHLEDAVCHEFIAVAINIKREENSPSQH